MQARLSDIFERCAASEGCESFGLFAMPGRPQGGSGRASIFTSRHCRSVFDPPPHSHSAAPSSGSHANRLSRPVCPANLSPLPPVIRSRSSAQLTEILSTPVSGRRAARNVEGEAGARLRRLEKALQDTRGKREMVRGVLRVSRVTLGSWRCVCAPCPPRWPRRAGVGLDGPSGCMGRTACSRRDVMTPL